MWNLSITLILKSIQHEIIYKCTKWKQLFIQCSWRQRSSALYKLQLWASKKHHTSGCRTANLPDGELFQMRFLKYIRIAWRLVKECNKRHKWNILGDEDHLKVHIKIDPLWPIILDAIFKSETIMQNSCGYTYIHTCTASIFIIPIYTGCFRITIANLTG